MLFNSSCYFAIKASHATRHAFISIIGDGIPEDCDESAQHSKRSSYCSEIESKTTYPDVFWEKSFNLSFSCPLLSQIWKLVPLNTRNFVSVVMAVNPVASEAV